MNKLSDLCKEQRAEIKKLRSDLQMATFVYNLVMKESEALKTEIIRLHKFEDEILKERSK